MVIMRYGMNIEKYESSKFEYFKQRPQVGHVPENFVPFLSTPFTKTNQYQDTMLNSHTWGLNKTEHTNHIPKDIPRPRFVPRNY